MDDDSIILKSLIKINRQRRVVYQHAADGANDLELRTVFLSMADDTRINILEIARSLKQNGIPADGGLNFSVTIHKVWHEMRSAFTGKDFQMILSSVENVEALSLRSYENALNESSLSANVRKLLKNQQTALAEAYDLIRNYRRRSHFTYARNF